MESRTKIRPSASGYSEAGASRVRRALKGFNAVSASPHEDIDWQNSTLRQRGRILYMSSPVATSAINTNRTKVVGTGLTMKSTIEREVLGLSAEQAKEWQRNTEREFRLWADKKGNCDATGMNNFAGLQQLAIKSWLMSGDVFALVKRYKPTTNCPYSLRIHLIEADRISTPSAYGGFATGSMTDGRNPDNGNKIHDGVEIDSNGQVVAYHVCNAYPYQHTTDPLEWTRVEAYGKRTGLPNIMHVMDSERPDQYRGVTYLAQVIEQLLNLSRYTQSELMAALIQSFYTAWIQTETDPTEIPFNEVGEGDDGTEGNVTGIGDSVSHDQNEYELGPGTVAHLQPGEKIVFGQPNVPSSGFESFFKTICKIIGAALEIPYDELVKEFNASYSASRAAIMEAWEAFKMRRQWLVDSMCQPTYEVWLAEAVALGRIHAPGFFSDPRIRAAWSAARWIGPVQGQLDPTKEVKADILAVDHGFKTHEQVAREYGGGDWEENVEQLAQENTALKVAKGSGDPSVDAIMNEADDEEEEDSDAQEPEND